MDAHYMKADDDCIVGYWRCFGTCSDGRVVIGFGKDEGEALCSAQEKIDEREKYLRMPDVDRLKILLDGDLLSTEAKEAMQIMGKLVLVLCDRFGSEPR